MWTNPSLLLLPRSFQIKWRCKHEFRLTSKTCCRSKICFLKLLKLYFRFNLEFCSKPSKLPNWFYESSKVLLIFDYIFWYQSSFTNCADSDFIILFFTFGKSVVSTLFVVGRRDSWNFCPCLSGVRENASRFGVQSFGFEMDDVFLPFCLWRQKQRFYWKRSKSNLEIWRFSIPLAVVILRYI